LEVVCGAFCPCVTVASAKRLTHVTDPRIRNDIVGPSWNCRSTTALNPRGAAFSSVVSAKGHKQTLADICTAPAHVCFTPKSGLLQRTRRFPLWARSGHQSQYNSFGFVNLLLVKTTSPYDTLELMSAR